MGIPISLLAAILATQNGSAILSLDFSKPENSQYLLLLLSDD